MTNLLAIATLLVWAACDSTSPRAYEDVAGTYEGTVRGSGDLVRVTGTTTVTVAQTEDSIGGDIILHLEVTGVVDTTVTVSTTFTGSVTEGTDPDVVLTAKNPHCGGSTDLKGTYTSETATVALTGRYTLRDPNRCSLGTEFDLTVSARKTS